MPPYWEKTTYKCNHCLERNIIKHLYQTNGVLYGKGPRAYICTRCFVEGDWNTAQQMCGSCNGIYHQSLLKRMCNCCTMMICDHCIETKNYYKCSKCYDGYSNIFCYDSSCTVYVFYKEKLYVTCKNHLETKTCSRPTKNGNLCKLITGPKRYCKKHRYNRKRRVYKRKV